MFIRGTTPWLRDIPMSGTAEGGGAGTGAAAGDKPATGADAGAAGGGAGSAAAAGGDAGAAAGGGKPTDTGAADGAAAGAGGSALADKPTDTTKPTAWRDDWRDAMAKGEDGKVDEKLRKQLDRYATPELVAKAYVNLRTKMDSGEVKQPLAADATPEQVAAWRKDNGIPDKPEGYLEKLPDGLVIGERDKPLVSQFLADLHGINAPPQIAHTALAAYYKIQASTIAQQVKDDQAFASQSHEALRDEWGREFVVNATAAENLVQTLGPPGLRDKIWHARMVDPKTGALGRLLVDDPDMGRFLAHTAREINPAASVLPAGSGGDGAKSIDARIGEIEGLMRGPDAQAKYFKNEAIQTEYRTLLEAKEKLRSRAA